MLRYGLIGGGFVSAFHLRALEQVRGIEVAALYSRTPPQALGERVRTQGLGPGKVVASIPELVENVDVVAIFGPNFARVETVEEIAAAVERGSPLRGLICEKPLARNMAEARRMLELSARIGAPTAYFENQLHMKGLRNALDQLAPVAASAGPLGLVRSSEEHCGPHAAWFWDPTQQGGGVLCDMGCHCIAVGWEALHPAGRGPRWLEPVSVQADVALLKWGRPPHRDDLRARFGIDFERTPAEDFATGIVTYRHPDTDLRVKAQFSVSWMYDKQGLRLLMEGLGPGYAFELNSLRSPLEVFVSDAAASRAADAEQALEKSTASSGLLAVQPNEPDLYGYTDEQREARDAFLEGRSARLDWSYGLEIVRLTMAAYLSAERGATVDLTDPSALAELETYVPAIQAGRGADALLAAR